MMTGRNHHDIGMGSIPEMATLEKGYSGIRPGNAATLARILQCNGYATAAFGKMHQTPPWESTVIGPFDRWPTGEGFSKFYGFLGAETNQFTPNLIEGTTPIAPPRTAEEGYHLSEDLVDQAITWIGSINALQPDKAWFTYLSFGACHAPFQVPKPWLDRYRGKFAHGWEVQRQRTLERQKQLGIVPPDSELSPWPDAIPEWDKMSPAQRSASERLMEAYAAFAEHTDVQVGRLVAMLEETKQLENTLVIYILGDNGASAEGGLDGTLNEVLRSNGFEDTAERIHAQLDKIGGPDSYVHYPSGWALAMNSPYQWAKTVASHYGGTRNGMIVHWGARLKKPNEIRHQWHHCVDVAPTILEAAGIPQPTQVDGFDQKPMDGTSFLYSFDDGDASERHATQYFELFGNRGIYHEGWTAVTKHRDVLAMKSVRSTPFAEDVWELYDTRSDWTQARNVAAEHPALLAVLKDRFMIEAARNGVFPLDDRFIERMNPAISGRQNLLGGRTSVVFRPGLQGLREDAAPNMKNTSFALTASIKVNGGATDGVLIAQGGRFCGWSLYVQGRHVVYCHNVVDLERHYVRSSLAIPDGRVELKFQFVYDGGGFGKGGTGTFFIDGQPAGTGRVPRTVPFLFSLDETMDIGRDRGTPVTDEYPSGEANAFQGELDFVRVDLLGAEPDVPRDELLRTALSAH